MIAKHIIILIKASSGDGLRLPNPALIRYITRCHKIPCMDRNEMLKCHNCSVEMQSYGRHELLMLSRTNFQSEMTLPLEVFVCPRCGRIDFYALDSTKKALMQRDVKPKMRECQV